MKDEKPIRASAPGKILISGEHFVVHGSYAVSAAINKRAHATVARTETDSEVVSDGERSAVNLDDGKFSAPKAIARMLFKEHGDPRLRIEIKSEIPSGSGLGSSSAVSVATAAALSSYFGLDIRRSELVRKISSMGEMAVHGNPSGVDACTSLNGGVLLYAKGREPKQISPPKDIRFVVAFSGKVRNTAELVSKVATRKAKLPFTFEKLIGSASRLSLDVEDAIEKYEIPRLGSLMSEAQWMLDWIGVSTYEIDNLVEKALASEGSCFGAKLTGAGGGGSIIALPKPEKEEYLAAQLSKCSRNAFLTSIPQPGLRIY